MNAETPAPKKRNLLLVLVAGAFALAAVLAAALLVNISEKKMEAKNPVVRVVEITDDKFYFQVISRAGKTVDSGELDRPPDPEKPKEAETTAATP